MPAAVSTPPTGARVTCRSRSRTRASPSTTLGTDFDTDSGGGGYSQYADCFTVSMVATGSTFVGNLARGIVGGGIFNVSYEGPRW